MAETTVCDYCGEEIDVEPIEQGNRVFCSQACAFEATRSQDCGGRTDVHKTEPEVTQE